MQSIREVGFDAWMELLRWDGRRHSFDLRMMWCDLYNVLEDLHYLASLEGADLLECGSPVGVSYSPVSETLMVVIADAVADRGRVVYVVDRSYPYSGMYALLDDADSLAMVTITDFASFPCHIHGQDSLALYRNHFSKCLDPLRPEDLQAVSRASSA